MAAAKKHPAARKDRGPDSAVIRRRRLVAVLVVAGTAAAGTAVALSGGRSAQVELAERYVAAWSRADYDGMHRLLTDDAQQRVSRARFAHLHREAAATATSTAIRPAGEAEEQDGDVRVPVTVATRLFGTLRADVALPVTDGDGPQVDWRRSLRFPGLADGEELSASLQLPERATLLTRDGGVLAEGPDRTPDPDLADVAAQTVGQLGPAPEDRRTELRARGVPDDARVGLSGLERALDVQLTGRPGGVLRAGDRTLATSVPRKAAAVRSTVDPRIERAAVTALAGRLGGVVALDPRSGEVLAFAGIAFSGLQPPGSTFKIITAVGGLEQGVTELSSRYPVQTAAVLEGVELQNANEESCGGSLTESFAESCNSVFGPMGAELGATELVEVAERFGFNRPAGIPGAATPTLPPADQIGDDLAVGSTAIGQGKVQATALTMARVASTIAMDGGMPELTLDRATARERPRAPLRKVTDAKTAQTVEKLMLAVVREGTGTLAKVPGVPVAGKTGTAELESTQQCDEPESTAAPGAPVPEVQEGCNEGPEDTTAWFAAYAPAAASKTRPPRVAVAVMLVRNGAGGDTAAPVAKQVLQAALKRGR